MFNRICNRIWRTGELSAPWTLSLITTFSKKGNYSYANLQNYQPHQSFKQSHAESDLEQA